MSGGGMGRAWLRHPTVGVSVGAGGEGHLSFARHASPGQQGADPERLRPMAGS